MATPNEKVTEFLSSAKDLMKTSKRMEDIFYAITKKNEKKIAVEYINFKGKIKHYRYNKFRSHSFELASALSQYLIQQPKNVPIILKVANSPHWGEMFFAILMCGYKPLLIDARTSKEGTIHVAEMSKALAVITDDTNQYDKLIKISIGDLLEEKHHYSFTPTLENEVIFSSSGTTGDVKLMVFNGENLCNQICCSLDMGLETVDIMYPKQMGKVKILAMIPFHHIFGFVAVFLWYSFYGKTIVFPASTAPSDIQFICQKTGVTHVYSVPLFWDSLAQSVMRKAALEGQQKVEILDKMIGYRTGKIDRTEAGIAASTAAKDIVQKKLLGNKVRFCISGGGFLSRETLTTINGLGYNLYNGFGMTEIGVTSVELSPEVEVRLKGRIGHPLHGVEYKIENDAQNGELMVKSPTIHVREIINGKERKTELVDGYFKTGDIAEKDATGGFYLRGRIKDIIINPDGENIFPDELEIFFKDLPCTQHLCVLGYSPEQNHVEKIALVLELDNKATEEDIANIKKQVEEIQPNLPHKVKIDGIFLSRGKLPLANNMKVKRFVIKKALEDNSKEYVPIDSKKKAKTFEGFDQETINSILIPMREIFSKVLILPEFKIEDDAHWINDLGGDSMSYVELIRDVQEKFGIEFPESLLGQMTCVNDFVYEVAKIKNGAPKHTKEKKEKIKREKPANK